jgi:hypothetical protein
MAAGLALAPFLGGLSGDRLFYIRDLSLYFWGRYLWVRRTLLSGEWPLWDPYVAAGQAAAADALHQLFLLPSLAVRLVGNEVLGFNLWVAVPFPLAAIGAWLFFARRFSAPAATLGAVAFALSGPVVSTGSFPNMSWAVAALPWTLWAIDRVSADRESPLPRRLAALAAFVALQALAGEPVTLFATLALGGLYAFTAGAPETATLRERFAGAARVCGGCTLGLVIAAVQLLPMAEAASLSERSAAIRQDFWSLHPLALAELVSLHLFGNYYTSQSLASVPWVPILNSGREPFFFSLYLGVPLLAVAAVGFFARERRSWTVFWASACAAALIGAFGGYTPIYPWLQDHLPVLGTFRFPVKYLVVATLALAASAAAGWDALHRYATGSLVAAAHLRRGTRGAMGLTAGVAILATLVTAACLYLPTPAAFRLHAIAQALDAADPIAAAAFLLRALPRAGSTLLLLAAAAGLLLHWSAGRGAGARWAVQGLFLLVIVDLLVRAWGINPVFEARRLAEPDWIREVPADSHARFYVGGKRDGTLDLTDPEGSPAYRNPEGLIGSASRAALSAQAAFYPSAWRRREMLSYDLAVLWPKRAGFATGRFMDAGRDERARFLDRTGVRYRVVPAALAEGRPPLAKIPYFIECYLYDFGPDVAPRAAVVDSARIVPEWDLAVEALLLPGWDRRTTVILSDTLEPEGAPSAPVSPYATVASDSPTRVVLDAGAGPAGGYLVLLDSYSEDWRVTVDGQPATMTVANGLFRGVRLTPGRHNVVFEYRPRAFLAGATTSGLGLLAVCALAAWPARRRSPLGA